MKAWLASLLDTRNRAAELHLLLTLIGALMYLHLWWFAVAFNHQTFDGQSFGIGFCAIVGGGGLASMMTAFGRRAENGSGDEHHETT